MSQPMLRVPSSELAAVRVVCTKCGTVTEFTPERLALMNTGLSCPGCRTELEKQAKRPLWALGKALEGLADLPGEVRVEFLVPVGPDGSVAGQAPAK